MSEIDLGSETNSIQRRDNVVIRNAGPHSATVHALLRHLEDVGFDGAPRVVGSGFDGSGRETLSFVEGEIAHPGQPTLEAATAVGVLIRRLHEATTSFVPPADALWQPWFGREIGTASTIGHCDAAPWNIVVREGLPVALIDWEMAGPVDPAVDLAQAAWLNARLYSDDIAERESLPPIEVRAQQLRALVDGYGLPTERRRHFVDAILEFAIHSVAADADQYDVGPESSLMPAQWGMAWRARSASWILHNRRALERALV